MKRLKIGKNRRVILLMGVLILSSLFTFVIYKTVSKVRAEERTWSQTNWIGGIGSGTVNGDVTTFSESSNIDHTEEGLIKLAKKDDWVAEVSDWKFRKEITIENTFASVGTEPEELTDFPIHIKLVEGENISHSDMMSSGEDIRFFDSSDTQLSYEIDSWNEEGVSSIWVKVPLIGADTTVSIYMYYGNSSATDNQNPTDVWGNGYAAVYHLSEQGGGLSEDFKDSTVNENYGIGGGGSVDATPTQSSGVVGFSQNFDGSNDYILLGNPEALRITGDMSISMFINPTNFTTRRNPYAKAYGGEGTMTLEPNQRINYYYGAAGINGRPYQGFNSSGMVSANEWSFISQVRDLTNMRLRWFINGVKTSDGGASYEEAVAGSLPAMIGDGYTSNFYGYIDEVWVSNVARSYAWTNATYKSIMQELQTYGVKEHSYESTGYLVSNIFDSGYPSDWGNINLNPANSSHFSVKVRSSSSESMQGASSWSLCTEILNNENVKTGGCVEDEDRYLQYRVDIDILDELITPEFLNLSIGFSASDQTPPTDNAHTIYLGNSRDKDDWLNFEPTVIWSAGADDAEGNGLEGYCISLEEVEVTGASTNLDPKYDAGILEGIDDGVNNDGCPYIVAGVSIDFSTVEGLTLQTGKRYYFSIKAVDLAGNVWEGISAEYQNLAWFRYDDTRPENVMYISTPSTDFGNINDMFFNWPITGSSQATDSDSGILGWQYAINDISNENWEGTEAHPKLGINYIPLEGLEEGVLNLSTQRDGILPVGNNAIYFRAIDNAGNVSTYVTGGINYGGAAPEFPAESVVTITPEVSESNEFSLSWPEAVPGDGDEIESYYYMINTQPPSSLSTLRDNNNRYIPTDSTSISSGKLVGAVKGTNNVYVVAVDNKDNYSPTRAIHGTFELNSTLPDPPQAVSTADLSIKASELWRTALTWEEPVYKGNGDLTYIIERSGDNTTWVEIARTSGLSYTDIVPESKTYYYKVASIDTSNESVADPSYSTTVELFPKGRYEEPPEIISNPVITDITTRYAKVTWVTDRVSDSKVQLGVSSNTYFQDEMYRSDQVTNHEIELTNLSPGTQYYFRVKWTDEDGNTGVSKESVFQTKPAPVVENVQVDSVGLNYAIFKLTTTGATKARIVYGLTNNYGGSQEINTSTASSEYSIMLTELQDGTDYHYKIILTDEEGFEYESFEDHVFTTPPRPQVSNVQIQEKKGVPTPTIEVFWESNIAVNSIVRYSSNGKSLDKVDMELIEGEHTMEIEGLDPDSEYQLTVEGVDAMGNRAVSDVYAFTTATDTRPPEISSIKSEGDIQSSDVQNDRSRSAQLIISWKTDEPSTSQVLYGEGASSDGYPYSTQTDSQMRYEHVMIVSNLSPSKVYHFKVVSKDSAGNVGESGSVTSITPKSTDTVMESVLGSLGRIFNFL
jgi:hypothetical protein